MKLDEAKLVLIEESPTYQDEIKALPDRSGLDALDDLSRELIETRLLQLLQQDRSLVDREKLLQMLREVRVALSRLVVIARNTDRPEVADVAVDCMERLGTQLFFVSSGKS